MKMLNCIKFLFPGIVTLLLVSCTNNDEINPVGEKPVASVPWGKVENLNLDVYNSLFLDEKLSILDRNNLYFDTHAEVASNPQSIISFQTRLGRYRLPLSKDIFATRSETEVLLFPNVAVNSDNSLVLNPKIWDPKFSSFEDIPFWQGDVMGMNPKGTSVLIPYRTTENGFATSNPNYLLLKTRLEDDKVIIKEHKLIKETFSSYFVETDRISSFSNFFLIQVEGKTYKITLNGEIELIANSALKGVELEDRMFFFEENRNESKIVVYTSDVYGNNFSPLGEFNLSLEVLGANYNVVDEQVIGYSGRNIFLVNIKSNSILTQMLNNEGLEGAISSITEVGKDKVLITLVRAGQGGAVTKPLASFFEKI